LNDGKYSDNSSQYEDVQNDLNDEDDEDQCEEDDQSDMYNNCGAEIENLLTESLEVPADMSPQFHRFYENFTKHIDFIIKYEYNLGSGTNAQNDTLLTDQKVLLKRQYDAYKKQCDKNCKCFTGPYSVLQIFIEKIVDAIQSFAQKLRVLAHDDLRLWEE